MKTRLARTAAVALAIAGLSIAPAAAALPGSHELPGGQTIVAPGVNPGGGQQITPDISFCQAVPWWLFCRI